MHVNQVQQLIETAARHYGSDHAEWYCQPWSLNRNTNKLRPLKEAGLLPSGRSGRYAEQLTAEQVGYIIIAALLGSCDREQVVDKVKLYASLKLAGENNIRISLLQRIAIVLADPLEVDKIDRLRVETTFPIAELITKTGRELYTVDGDETKLPPANGSGQVSYMGYTHLVTLAAEMQAVGGGWTGKYCGSVLVETQQLTSEQTREDYGRPGGKSDA